MKVNNRYRYRVTVIGRNDKTAAGPAGGVYEGISPGGPEHKCAAYLHRLQSDGLKRGTKDHGIEKDRIAGRALPDQGVPPGDGVQRRLHTLMDDLKETLLDSGGVGLAAPQVGVLRRVCVVMNEDDEIIELVNPEIIATDGGNRRVWRAASAFPESSAW